MFQQEKLRTGGPKFTREQVAKALEQTTIPDQYHENTLNKLFGEEDYHDRLTGYTFEGGREEVPLGEVKMSLYGTGINQSVVCMQLYNWHKEAESESEPM